MSAAGWLSKRLIFILGKGGVGKSLIAEAAARHLAARGKRVLLCHILQLTEEEQKIRAAAPGLDEITLNSADCFREYVILKVRLKTLYSLFLGNRLTQYLQRAAPGVREMVLLGKVWYERQHYDHVVVDMPSTGYALTMVHTPFNFAALFPGGPIYHDANDIISTFRDPSEAAFVNVAIPEEMPVQESLELIAELDRLMPANPAWLVFNRVARVDPDARNLYAREWANLSGHARLSPLWRGLDHMVTKELLQERQLRELEGKKYGGLKWLTVEEAPAAGHMALVSEARRALEAADAS